jgi:hypothetical protein
VCVGADAVAVGSFFLGTRIGCDVRRNAFASGQPVVKRRAADAERLYERAGWPRAGVVPKYALMPDGAFPRQKINAQ